MAAMQPDDLRKSLTKLGLEKSELANLLGVSLRAMNMWSSGDREIPGPAVAYIRLLQALPPAIRAETIAQLSNGNPIMYDGMYTVNYAGPTGQGSASLVLKDGIVFGHDGGVKYDGTYSPSLNNPGQMDLNLWLTVPPGVPLVMAVPPQPAEYRFPIQARVLPRSNTPLNIQTPFGAIVCSLVFVRTLPDQLAA